MNGLTPSQDQLVGQLRILIPIIGAVISGLGWVSEARMGPIISNLLIALGPLSYLGSAIWSLYANSRHSILSSAAKPSADGELPHIQLPKSEQDLAASLPSNVTVKE
jgi:hypothetical protein